MKHTNQEKKAPGRWLSAGLPHQTRRVGELAWKETVSDTPIRVPEDATLDRIGQVTFRVNGIEYRVWNRQIRIGTFGATGDKPKAKSIKGGVPSEDLRTPTIGKPGARVKTSSKLQAHRLVKKWKEKHSAIDPTTPPVELPTGPEVVVGLEPVEKHVKHVPLSVPFRKPKPKG